MENVPPDQLVLAELFGELHQREVEIVHNSELSFLTSNFHAQVTCARMMCCKQDNSNCSNKLHVLPSQPCKKTCQGKHAVRRECLPTDSNNHHTSSTMLLSLEPVA